MRSRRRSVVLRARTTVISILQTGVSGAELLGRRLEAMRGRVDAGLVKSLDLDSSRCDSPAGHVIYGGDTCRQAAAILVSGVAAEAKMLAKGRRQILALRLPGDSISATPGEVVIGLTRTRIADGSRLMAALADGSDQFQPLRRAWVASGRTDQALLRDQVVRLGRMSAFERVAHLLLEIHERLAQVGLTQAMTFHLPLTQEMIGDVIGLSVVHLNRTLQALRREGLVSTQQGYVTLLDRQRLVEVAAYVSRFPVPWRSQAATVAPWTPRVRELATAY